MFVRIRPISWEGEEGNAADEILHLYVYSALENCDVHYLHHIDIARQGANGWPFVHDVERRFREP